MFLRSLDLSSPTSSLPARILSLIFASGISLFCPTTFEQGQQWWLISSSGISASSAASLWARRYRKAKHLCLEMGVRAGRNVSLSLSLAFSTVSHSTPSCVFLIHGGANEKQVGNKMVVFSPWEPPKFDEANARWARSINRSRYLLSFSTNPEPLSFLFNLLSTSPSGKEREINDHGARFYFQRLSSHTWKVAFDPVLGM